MNEITRIYSARRILTINPSRPEATHVAVREGRILGVGTLEELVGWGAYTLDDTFSDKVILPGFVEGHSHSMEGTVWNHTYVGFHSRRAPDGKSWTGVKSINAVIERLQAAQARLDNPDTPLLAWGFDPIYFGEQRMSTEDLNQVSTTRPILVMHASFHIMNVNQAILDRVDIRPGMNIEGVVEDSQGHLTGELRGPTCRYMVLKTVGEELWSNIVQEETLWQFARAAQLAGVTTATDLHNELPQPTVMTLREVTAADDFPARIVPALAAAAQPPHEGVEKLNHLRTVSQEKLRFGLVKIVADGSIQGFSARLRWPGYFNGAPNGMWYVSPSELREWIAIYHRGGAHIHVHTNGDQASEVTIDALEKALRENPHPDHRHTLQHCQMADAALFRRMAALGVCVNLFSNHLYYWGDAHRKFTLGPERTCRMDATGTALRTGVAFAIHSDAPITPIGPLFTAWCAVNRRSSSGRLLGEEETISVAEALRAITLGAAYTLKLDREIGSIEVGKRADFAILEDDPLTVPPEALKDIPIWGTVLGGRVFRSPQFSASVP